jgi:NhaP-type Na+/H+ or K+/H+ antiporter
MRGGLSLAAALALPREVADGSPFPARGLILVIAAAVIVATLVLQGTTLPWLMRRLGVGREDHSDHERQARLLATRAALDRLQERAAEGASEEVVAPLRTLYTSRLRHFAHPESRQSAEGEVYGYEALRLEMLATERSVIMAEHDEGRINADVLRRIEHSLDLEESRLLEL